MKAVFYSEQIKQVLQVVEQNAGYEAEGITHLPVNEFIDPQRLALEREMFRRLPLIVGHSSELARPGDFVVRELDNRSWLLVRGKDGVARAFYNYCQHRGTKLVHESDGCQQRFACPYHSWTYDAQGQLIGVPRADLFPGLDKSKKGLKQVDLQEYFGFLWLTQDIEFAQPVADYVDGLQAELETLDLGKYHVYFDRTRALKASWKLPVFAFLESYHIGTLHRESIAEFFLENVAYSERFGPHIRSFVPRKTVGELVEADLEKTNLAEYITPTNILFPNVCMIAHPTSYSIISMFPGDTPDTSWWRHMLLVPKLPETDAERAHYDKTVQVLDGMTYKSEDFWASEQIQAGINAGAIDELTLAKNEIMLQVFNDTVADYLPSST
ncbi:MAG: aromatic ring-hydroxylating dioxygenase subunit alpha [Gammaproteobacteria bacterium]|nr:aromatic ring-hydroxylating dioxygenase subunit alpha [Gammaproteobacteria bacterium]